jgi:glutathione synthase
MPAICFFTTLPAAPVAGSNDNVERLPRAFRAAGWQVAIADHRALCLAGSNVSLRDADGGTSPLSRFDLIWVLGFGPRDSFLDRMELLQSVPSERFVNAPAALLTLHAKYGLPLSSLADHHPETYASTDAAWLVAIVERGGDWIAKPPAMSFGRSVFRVQRSDPNVHVIIEQLTGFDGSRYCLLQRYVPEIEHGEKRILVAGGEIIGAYLRLPARDHRANLSGDGHAAATSLTSEEMRLARQVAESLADNNVRYAAVDVAWPWVIEYNIVNPGGLATMERLTGEDLSPRVVAALTPR